MDFRVDLAVFRGPMDLLLYLVRKHEVDILDLPIAPITDQYLEYLAVLEQLDVNAVGDFVAMASRWWRSSRNRSCRVRTRLQEEVEDPRQELVRRLLEYKKYRDAASILEERSRNWQQHYPAAGRRSPAAAARSVGRADPRSRVVGSGQRLSAGSCASRPLPGLRASCTTTRRSTFT